MRWHFIRSEEKSPRGSKVCWTSRSAWEQSLSNTAQDDEDDEDEEDEEDEGGEGPPFTSTFFDLAPDPEETPLDGGETFLPLMSSQTSLTNAVSCASSRSRLVLLAVTLRRASVMREEMGHGAE